MKMELSFYRGQIQKLEEFCQGQGMEYEITRDQFPLMMRIRPTPGYMQLSILEKADEKARGRGVLTFTLEDGEVHYKISDGFSIGEGAFNKLKGFFTKLTSYYLQYFFRTAMTDPTLVTPSMAIMTAIGAEDV